MKRNIFLWMLAATVVLAMGSCKNGKKDRNYDVDEDDDEVEQTSSYGFPKDDESPSIDAVDERSDFTFTTRVIADEDDVAQKIIVSMYNRSLGSTLESEVSAEPLDTTLWCGFGKVSENDINFDGYPDLLVCRGPVNSYGNFTYAAWLWDHEAHQFIPVKDFEELFDPVYNEEEQVVTSSFRMDDHEDYAVYRWNGNELELVSSETIVYSDLDDDE